MSIHYVIYQIEHTDDEHVKNRIFEELREDVTEVSMKADNYKKVFEGDLEPNRNTKRKVNPNIALNYLFEIFNTHHPKAFKGRSLCVSDIVKLQNKYYHCQSIGWKEIQLIS